MRTLRTIVISSLGACAMVVPASAQEVNAPPGNAGIDEYLESVPQASGNRSSYLKGTPLPAEARAKLEQQGADGAAVAQLAEATGPKTPPPSRAGSRRPGASGASGSDQALRGSGGGSIVESVAQTAAGSSNGMGPALPIILALAAGLGAGALLTRRRRPPTGA